MTGWSRRRFLILSLLILLTQLLPPLSPTRAGQQDPPPTGALIITLQDDTMAPVAGAVFDVSTSAGTRTVADESGTGTVFLTDLAVGPATVTLLLAPEGYDTGAAVVVDILPGESAVATLTTSRIEGSVTGNTELESPSRDAGGNEAPAIETVPGDTGCDPVEGSSTCAGTAELSDAIPATSSTDRTADCLDDDCDASGPLPDTGSPPMRAASRPNALVTSAMAAPYTWSVGNLVLTVEPPGNLENVSAGTTLVLPVTVYNAGDFQPYLAVILNSSREEINRLDAESQFTVNFSLQVTAEHIAAGAILVPGITLLDISERAIGSTPPFSFPIGTPVSLTEIALGDIAVTQATCKDGIQPPGLVLPGNTDQVTYSATPARETYAPGDVVTVSAIWDATRYTVADPGPWDVSADTPGVATRAVTFTNVPCAALLVGIAPSPDSYAFVGETIRYDITVTNTGNLALSNLTLTGSGQGIPLLLPGERVVIGSGVYETTSDDVADGASITLTATVSGTVVETSAPISTTGEATVPYVAPERIDLETAPAWDEAVCKDGVLSAPALRLPPDTEKVRFTADVAEPYAPGQVVTVHAMTVGLRQFGALSTGWVIDEDNGNRDHATYEVTFADVPCTVPARPVIEVDVLVIDKQVEYGPGTPIAYAITLTNSGNVPLSGVTVTSSLVEEVACESDTIAPGMTIGCTARYLVEQADIDAGTPLVHTLSATGTAPDGVLKASATGSAEVRVIEALPALSLSPLASPARVSAAGQQITYTFTVTNSGNVTVTNLAIDATLLAEASRPVTCDIAVLAPGTSTDCRGTFVVDLARINDGGSIDNIATATGIAQGSRPIRSSQATTTVAIDRNPNISLTKAATQVVSGDVTRAIGQDEEARDLVAGDIVTYRLVATNTGNVTVTEVLIADSALSPLRCDHPVTLDPGQSLTCEGDYVFTEQDATTWSGIVQAAGATANAPGSGTLTASASTTIWPAIPAPRLAVSVAADRATYSRASEPVTYAITVTNSGKVPVSRLQVSASGLTGDPACDLPGTLEPGATASCTAKREISQADLDTGSASASVRVTGAGLGSTPAEATATTVINAVQSPALGFTKRVSMVNDETVTDPVSGLRRGDIVTYTLVASNTGNVTLPGVNIADTLEGDQGLHCVQPASLTPGSSLTCTLSRTISQEDIDRGSLTGDATATATAPGGARITRTASATVTAVAAAPGIAFAVSASPDEAHRAGDIITWSFAVTNSGNVTLDTIAVQSSLVDASGIACPGTTIAPGKTLTCTASSVVTQEQMDSGDALVNEASATGRAARAGSVTTKREAADPRLVASDASIASVPVIQAPALALTVTTTTPPGQKIRLGTVVTFEFVVANTGNTTLRDVIIEDDMLSDMIHGGSGSPAVGTLAPGDSRTVKGTLVLSDATLKKGAITDTARATNGPTRSADVTLNVPLDIASDPTPTPTSPVQQTPTPSPPSQPATTPTPAATQEAPRPTDPVQPTPTPTATPDEVARPGGTTPPAPGQRPSSRETAPASDLPEIDAVVVNPEITGLPSTGQAASGTVNPGWIFAAIGAFVLVAAGVGIQRRDRS